ncbi:MAG: hypothetical protein KDD40_09905, partial [Bdellovibrionales bacterium]|nr:hypothetical protein [Bdellovibrionales bacterium]
ELAPENILAYQVLAELKLRSKQPKEALKAFKMVLFLSPDNFKAQNAVKKLESLTADEFPESLFDDLQVKPFTQNSNQDAPVSQSLDPKPAFIRPNNFSNDAKQNRLERYLSLMDAYIVRNDNDKAMAIFTEARMEFANHTELLKRLHIINPQTISQQIKTDSARGGPPLRQQESSDARVQILRKMLFNINKRRKAKIQD